jgi:hypothetical protein
MKIIALPYNKSKAISTTSKKLPMAFKKPNKYMRKKIVHADNPHGFALYQAKA